ncbi:MAG: D-glycero-beta-D-manno-heptose 1-phosphate adenylyltransferase [Candidatus Omnitrophica bacterium]|nr:D-glycero-beta-D-manno-heptose 1-phosphate adenylyltransferase [Candidatus Omnitrophota bacterium]
MHSKVKSLSALQKLRNQWKRQSKKVVFTNGCFDVLHFGHVSYLRKAKAAGDVLILGLNNDASVRKIKGPDRPVNSEKDRAEVISELVSVDAVILFGEDTPEKLICALKPDVLVKGADWKKEDIVGGKFVESYGGSVKRIKFEPGRSTTKTLQKLNGA